MDNDFVLAPALVNVRFDLQPAANALQSLRLLNDLERLSGMHDWVTRTGTALSPERLYKNKLIFGAFEPALCIMEHRHDNFPALLDFVERQKPESLITAMDEELDYMFTHYPEHMARVDKRVTMTELLRDRGQYIDFMNKIEDCTSDVMWGDAFDIAQNPADMQRYLVEHLRYMWDNHLRAEWEHQLPMLNESISAFSRLDFSDKTAIEAARIVTNRDMRDLLEKKIVTSETVTFVPSLHLGPYVSVHSEAGALSIFFGARLPRGAQSTAISEFSRAELLMRLNALADDTRLQILELLTQNDEMCAQDIIERLDVSQSTISRHLSQLRATGYIIERRREVSKCYSLNTDRVVDTLRALTNFLSRQ